jgi:hypothetical protein
MARKIEILDDDVAFERFGELAAERTQQIAAKKPLTGFLIKNKDENVEKMIQAALEAVAGHA